MALRSVDGALLAAVRCVGVVLLFTLAVACGTPGQSDPAAGGTSASPPAAFVAGDRLLRPNDSPMRLATPAVGGLMGWLSPVAVPSPDHRHMLYMSWTDQRVVDNDRSFSDQGIETGDPLGRPSIRLLDTESGEDRVFEDGAYSAAWGPQGVAFFKGSSGDYEANTRFVGDIFVRSSLDGPFVQWSSGSPESYVVIAWARESLLAYRVGEGEALDLLVFDAPGQMRILAEDAALVALSPDGSNVVVNKRTPSGSFAQVLDVATGAELAKLDLAAAGLQYLGYGGSWARELIVAESAPGIAVLHFDGTDLRVEREIRIPPTEAPMGVNEVLLVEDASRVITWAPLPGQGNADRGGYVYLECVFGGGCTRSDVFDSRTFFAVYNPSRPGPAES